MASAGSTDDDSCPDASGSQSGRKTSISINSLDVLGVNQLLESVSKLIFCLLSISCLAHNYFYLCGIVNNIPLVGFET